MLTMLALAPFLLGGVFIALPFNDASSFTASIMPPTIASFPEHHEIATWVWEGPDTFNEFNRSVMLDEAKKEGVSTIYLRIDGYMDIIENSRETLQRRATQAAAFSQSLFHFVRMANAYGIHVHALAGHPAWAEDTHDYIPRRLVDYVLEYNTAHPDARLAGIHFDIESYNQPAFSRPNEQRRILASFVALVDELTERVEQNDPELALGFALPFWLDGATRQLPQVTLNGKTQHAAFHVIDSLNRIPNGSIVLMAYRNKHGGHNGTVRLVEDEILYANNTRVKVIVANETTNVEPRSITFFNRRRSDVKYISQKIADAYANHPSFGGIAVHDLKGYLQLRK